MNINKEKFIDKFHLQENTDSGALINLISLLLLHFADTGMPQISYPDYLCDNAYHYINYFI